MTDMCSVFCRICEEGMCQLMNKAKSSSFFVAIYFYVASVKGFFSSGKLSFIHKISSSKIEQYLCAASSAFCSGSW